ncbi:hypothetical protein CAPTEDRAFT_220640 [Capitella teleta]|uniref:Caspase-8 n=1 Tax=Capitella teleta TaxID=283909 RepID=R7TE95_CAPTE|nr:hypothetical protein CAPTEDRAFT_220640 [Capitella teleta]|eukprot:ELT91797.1 hypothetical protein CAPTEDRAFT_220640 [Capitella teleta]
MKAVTRVTECHTRSMRITMETDASVYRQDLLVLLKQLDECLGRNDLVRMKFLCADIIPKGQMEQISRGIHLMEELIKRDRLTPGNLLLLNQLLYKIGRHDLLRTIGVNKTLVERTFGHEQGILQNRILLHDLAEQMTKEDLELMKFFCLDAKITRIPLNNTKNPQELFSLMEECGVIHAGDLSFLREVFRRMQRNNLLAILGITQTDHVRPLCEGSDTSSSITDFSLHSTSSPPDSVVPLRNPPMPPFSPQLRSQLPRYKMTSKPRGVCLIINNKIFTKDPNDLHSRQMSDRQGTDMDRAKLAEVFKKLDFIIKVENDLSDQEIEHRLRKYGQHIDHSRYDCFVCCLLTHGAEGRVYGSNGRSLKIKELMRYFKAQNAHSLRGKPKIFFINACQGKEKQLAVDLETDSPYQPLPLRSSGRSRRAETQPLAFATTNPVETDAPGGLERETIPDEADFLLGYASVPGYVSFRSKQDGSWYISVLCHMLNKFAASEDLLSILTKVNEEIGRATANQDQKQCPAPLFTLRKKLFFFSENRGN